MFGGVPILSAWSIFRPRANGYAGAMPWTSRTYVKRRSRTVLLVALGVWIVLGGRSWGSTDLIGEIPADSVLGQPGFTTDGCNQDGIAADTLCNPIAAATDPVSGRLYVSDFTNSRVLGYLDAATFPPGQPADLVIGQADFTSSGCGTGPERVCRPTEVLVDADGNLYVADRLNYRVLEFDDPIGTDGRADRVFGQRNMGSRICALGRRQMCGPRGLALDAAGNLYVSDQGNSRILVYVDPLNDQVADAVLGAPTFDVNIGCAEIPSASDLCIPRGIDVDGAGTVWVADGQNNRVVAFLDPLGSDGVADLVLGQTDFSTKECNYGGVSATSLCGQRDVKVTTNGTVFVADFTNSRVLAYKDPFGTDGAADGVIGQPTFGTRNCNHDGLTAETLCLPRGLELDDLAHLYVADSRNSRVLRYDP
jgi:DNA-binding beta-propeller fold protein YncE